MIVSLNFLSNFHKHKFSIEEIKNAWIKSGIEIKSDEAIITPTNLCYGIIKNVDKIKDSKKLNYCEVFIPNTQETFKIICGAHNVRVGLKVVVAKVNAKIYNNTITIEKKTIFGHESEGMICGYSELYKSNILKIPKNLNLGIIELDENWDCSKAFSPWDLNLNDHIFDLEIPIHRGDLNCVWSLAMEIQKNLGMDEQYDDLFIPIKDFSHWRIRSLLWNNNFFDFTDSLEKEQYLYAAFNVFMHKPTSNTIENNSFLINDSEENKNTKYKIYEKSSYFQIKPKMYCKYDIPIKVHLPKAFEVNWENISLLFNRKNIQQEVEKFLTKAHFKFEKNIVTPPEWRLDLKDEGTFLNEISILFPINEIDEQAPEIKLQYNKSKNQEYKCNKKISDFLTNLGFIECITPNFQQNETTENYCFLDDTKTYKLSNSSSSKNTLRKHALWELLEVLDFNWRHKNETLPIFELTNISNINSHYWVCNIVMVNATKDFAINNTVFKNDIYDLLAIVKRLSKTLQENWEFQENEQDQKTMLNITDVFVGNKMVKIIKNNKIIGYVGNLKPQYQGIDGKTTAAIINLNACDFTAQTVFKEVSLYPVSIKDISIIMPKKKITLKTIIDLIKETEFCIDCKLMEKYNKPLEEIDQFQTTYVFQVFLQSKTGTLTNEQIHDAINTITAKLEEKGITIQ